MLKVVKFAVTVRGVVLTLLMGFAGGVAAADEGAGLQEGEMHLAAISQESVQELGGDALSFSQQFEVFPSASATVAADDVLQSAEMADKTGTDDSIGNLLLLLLSAVLGFSVVARRSSMGQSSGQ